MDLSSLPKPKLLKSCIRCRKHKIKCDAFSKNPSPCSSCQKKKIPCKIDYVLPPQRSDNLKDLVNQVDFIKDQIDKLNNHYASLSKNLKLNLPSFESWKNLSLLDQDQNNNNLNLIKLSNDSFISLNLTKDFLIINQNYINTNQFQIQLDQLSKKLNQFFKVFNLDSTLFDLEFNTEELFNNNKFKLLILIQFFNPHLKFNFHEFLSSYLSSYYSIANQLSNSINTSTYSSNLNILLNENTMFTKNQLSKLINVEIFNSEIFLKKLLNLLFLNFLINGNLSYISNLTNFIKNNINNNRKRLNFDKNLNLKFIENFISLINSEKFENHTIDSLTSLSQLLVNLEQQSVLLQSSFLKNWKFFNQYISNSFHEQKNNNSIIFIDRFLIELFAITLKSLSMNNNDKESSIIFFNLLNSLQSSNLLVLQKLRDSILNNNGSLINFSIPKLTEVYSKLMNKPANLDHDDISSSIEMSTSASISNSSVSNSSVGSISPVLTDSLSIYSDDEYMNLHKIKIEPLTKSSIKKLPKNNSKKSLVIDEDILNSMILPKESMFIYPNSIISNNNTNDEVIQNILESVDWKRETTDDVLKKIGVTI